MVYYSIAGITVGYDAKYDMLKKRSEPYKILTAQSARLEIELDYNELEKSLPQYPLLSIESLEYMRVGSVFYTALISDCLLYTSPSPRD